MRIEIGAQPGPQSAFLASRASIAIFGGGAGGGKTYAILLEILRHINNPKFNAIIFRRNTTNIRNPGGLWDTSMQLYGAIGATPRQAFLEWTFPSGATVKMAHLENADTVLSYQGAQMPLICCEENEKVLMGDGSYKKIASIVIGDFVQTLQGKRKVLFIGNRRFEECVELNISDKIQIHSRTHKILTPSGWRSYDDALSEKYIFCGLRRVEIFLSKQYCFFYKYAKHFAKKCQALLRPLDNLLCRLRLKYVISLVILDSLNLLGFSFCTGRANRDIGSGSCMTRRSRILRRPSIHLSAIRFLRFPESAESEFSRASYFGGSPYVRHEKVAPNSKANYSSSPRQYDESGLFLLKSIRRIFRKLIDVVKRSPTGLPSGEPDKIQKRSRNKLRYTHPYRGFELQSEAEYSVDSCVVSPCGSRWVKDLTIEDDSHYITETGLVNKNCWDELTHFEESQFWYMMSRLRSSSGVPGYVRATCNPEPDSFVRTLVDWWIDADGFPIKERSGILRWFIRQNDSFVWADSAKEIFEKHGTDQIPKSATFIPSLVYDNKILMRDDPTYLSNLHALSRVDRMRLLDGNWNVRAAAGMLFQRQWFKIVDAVPSGWIRSVRFWDRASTKPNESNKDPDWTRGLKIYRYPDGRFCVVDLKSDRDTPGQIENLIKNTASHDGISVKVMSQQDPGSAGVMEAEYFIRMLAGYVVGVMTTSKDKITRAKPVSAQCEAGNILVLRAPWNEEFFRELENFPDAGSHDDIVDVLSGAFNELCGGLSLMDVL